MLVEDVIEPGGVERSLDGEAAQDSDGAETEEALNDLVEHGTPWLQDATPPSC
jgi:hypothetical protein